MRNRNSLFGNHLILAVTVLVIAFVFLLPFAGFSPVGRSHAGNGGQAKPYFPAAGASAAARQNGLKAAAVRTEAPALTGKLNLITVPTAATKASRGQSGLKTESLSARAAVSLKAGPSAAAADSGNSIDTLSVSIADAAEANPAAIVPDKTLYKELEAGKKIMPNRKTAPTDAPTLYLTFDDGPSRNTPKVLDILDKEGVKATFFVIGQCAETYPDYVRRIVQDGNAIGNHSYDHVYHELYPNFQNYWDQIQKTNKILERIAGVHTKLLRAPGGTFENYDAFYFYLLDQAGYRIFDWTIDSGDSTRAHVPAAEIIRTAEKGPFHHDTVLLLHDGAGHGESVKALPTLIDFFKKKGYKFATLNMNTPVKSFPVSKKQRPHHVTFTQFAHYLSEVTGRPLPAGFDAPASSGDRAQQNQPSPANIKHASLPADEVKSERNSTPVQPSEPDVKTDIETPSSGTQQPAVRIMPIYAAGRKTPDIPLTVYWRHQLTKYQSGQYLFASGEIYVPLRKFFESMGGSVVWKDRSQTAQVAYNGMTLRYQLPDSHSFGGRLTVTDKTGRGYPQPFHLIDGTLYIGLRDTAHTLHAAVDSYSITSEKCTVTVS